MPEISRFLGIIIRMYFDDHNPPHFHAFYQNYVASFEIRTGEIIEGRFPEKQKAFVKAWAFIHQQELKENWHALINGKNAKKVDPLR
jgi:hypothetical protein